MSNQLKKIKDQVAREKNAFYGDEELGGQQTGLEKDDDTEASTEASLGNPPGYPFTQEKEVDKDQSEQ